MVFRNAKILLRIKPVIGNSLFLSFPSIANLVLSLLVIRIYNPVWWGNIVALQIIYYLVTNLTAWGNKEFLLREFSNNPSIIKLKWSASLNTRAVFLLIPSFIFIFIIYPSVEGIYLSSWILLRFFQQSAEAIITYHKKFGTVILSEILAFVFMAGSVFYFKNSSYENLLLLISISYFIKTVLPFILLRNDFLFSLKMNILMISSSVAFMLLSFTNVAESKVDALLVNMMMTKSDLAIYGVLTSFFLLIKATNSFVIFPFAKTIFRLNKNSIKLLSLQFLKYGLLITAVGFTGAYFILKYFYQFDLSISVFVFGVVFVVPSFWYSPVIFYFFQQHQQMKVVWITIFGIVVNALLCLLLIRTFGLNGALAGMSISQVAMCSWFYFYFYKTTIKQP